MTKFLYQIKLDELKYFQLLFCIYILTGLAVTFILVWHVTFFTACVAIYGYIEQKNAHSITCIPVSPVSQSRKFFFWIRSYK